MKALDHSGNFIRDPWRSMARAAIAHAHWSIERKTRPVDYVEKTWEFDTDAHLLTRAATHPLTISESVALAEVATAFLPALVPYSAGAKLFSMCTRLTFDGRGSFSIPDITAMSAGFVAENSPKAVLAGVSRGATLNPYKLAALIVASSELLAQGSVETIFQNTLAEAAARGLDTVLFSNAAATSASPAGLLNGIAGLTPSAPGTKTEAISTDLVALIAAVAPVAGGGDIVIVVNPAQAAEIGIRTLGGFKDMIIPNGNLASGTVIAIATPAVVSAFGAPTFSSSSEAAVHMSDTPGAIVASSPTSSMWQTANIAIKMVNDATWALRSTSGVAWMTGVNW
jgi:hypothetical protein